MQKIIFKILNIWGINKIIKFNNRMTKRKNKKSKNSKK